MIGNSGHNVYVSLIFLAPEDALISRKYVRISINCRDDGVGARCKMLK
jgi:hypothetical protein